jgi:hypothetical protein
MEEWSELCRRIEQELDYIMNSKSVLPNSTHLLEIEHDICDFLARLPTRFADFARSIPDSTASTVSAFLQIIELERREAELALSIIASLQTPSPSPPGKLRNLSATWQMRSVILS